MYLRCFVYCGQTFAIAHVYFDALLRQRLIEFKVYDIFGFGLGLGLGLVLCYLLVLFLIVKVVRALLADHQTTTPDASSITNHHQEACYGACKHGCVKIATMLSLDLRVTLEDWDIETLRGAADDG
jgi:hypothetical protein